MEFEGEPEAPTLALSGCPNMKLSFLPSGELNQGETDLIIAESTKKHGNPREVPKMSIKCSIKHKT